MMSKTSVARAVFCLVALGLWPTQAAAQSTAQPNETTAEAAPARRVEFRADAQLGAAQRSIVDPPSGPLRYRVPWSAMYGFGLELRLGVANKPDWWIRVRAAMSASMGLSAEIQGDAGSEQEIPLRHQRWGLVAALDRELDGKRVRWRLSPELGYSFLPVFSHLEHAVPNYLMHGPQFAFGLGLQPLRSSKIRVGLNPIAQLLLPDAALKDSFRSAQRETPGAQLSLGLAAEFRVRIRGHLALALSWESYRGLVDVGMSDRTRRAAWFTLSFDDLH